MFEDFSMTNISLETFPEELLSETLKSVYADQALKGQLDVDIEDGFMQMSPEGPQSIDVQGGLGLGNIACGQNGDIQQLSGRAEGQLQAEFAHHRWQIRSHYDIDQFLWHGLRVTDLRGEFVYDPNTRHLQTQQFVADVCEGKVIGDFEIDLSESEKADYKLGLSVTEASVRQLLAADYEQAMENIFEGLASGAVSLEGDLRMLADSRGKVTARVQNIRLGQQSFMGKVLVAMQLKTPKEFVFHEIECQGLVRGSELLIESVRMVGDPMVFRGTGTMNLETRQIQMDFVAFDRLMGREDTILDKLARGIGSALWKIEVKGDVENPTIDAVYLSVLKQPLNLFKKKE